MRPTTAERKAEAEALEKFIQSVAAGKFHVGYTLTAPDAVAICHAASRINRQIEATRKAGQVRSEAKTAAVRENASKPRKKV